MRMTLKVKSCVVSKNHSLSLYNARRGREEDSSYTIGCCLRSKNSRVVSEQRKTEERQKAGFQVIAARKMERELKFEYHSLLVAPKPHGNASHVQRKRKKRFQVPPRFELGSLDSESRVLTITPWDLTHLALKKITKLNLLSLPTSLQQIQI